MESAGTSSAVTSHPKRKWGRLLARASWLYLTQRSQTADLVRASYDRVATLYDQAWTHLMRDLSMGMLDQLHLPHSARCIDLACGTGFLTAQLQHRTEGHVIGIDTSASMIEQARKSYTRSQFEQSDMLDWLRRQDDESADIITCGWALGYSKPWKVCRQIGRVLRPGGMVGIIDNSLFSLSEVLRASMRTFAENPAALTHVMKVAFLPSRRWLWLYLTAAGLSVKKSFAGSKTFFAPDGQAAMEHLTSTGAAGFDLAADEATRAAIRERFTQVLQQDFARPEGVPVTHRYIGAIAVKR